MKVGKADVIRLIEAIRATTTIERISKIWFIWQIYKTTGVERRCEWSLNEWPAQVGIPNKPLVLLKY